jgi:hypothetical protein
MFLICLLSAFGVCHAGENVPISDKTRSCLACHRMMTPGIVEDWKTSRHSLTTLSAALERPVPERRISVAEAPEGLGDSVVGCYECHGLNSKNHADSFSHYGHRISVVVSPNDCSVCHPEETEQYAVSKKANAIGNLAKNPVYHTLVETIIGLKEVNGTEIKSLKPSDHTRQDACFACHGTEIKVNGMKNIETPYGLIKVPDLANWPNQGVGRINPDGSMGACTSCHARHAFSIEVARKPYTCAQCHLEPDVPAWNVYAASKHGNIFLSSNTQWEFSTVPWRLGKDFTAPTCAVCHVSLVAKSDGAVIVSRSHDFGSRLWVRLFGLIYTHAQPKKGDTSIIKNSDGLPMPTTFGGEPASEYLIDADEQKNRKALMQAVCTGCHSTDWVNGHFAKLESTIEETDRMTLAATKLISSAWEAEVADNANPFDEAIEQNWVKQWLFYGNTARYASAMTGAQDYVAFKYGWWGLTTNLQQMRDKIRTKIELKRLSGK